MNLSGQQCKKLRDALISAFPEKSLLEQLLYFELNKQLNQITQDSDLRTIVFQLIKRAEAEGWLVDLIQVARQENAGNSKLAAIYQELFSLKTSSVSLLEPSSFATVPELTVQQQKIKESCDIISKDVGKTTLQKQINRQQTDNFSSEKNIDYTRLQDLLKVGKWKEADYETYLVMLQVFGQKEDEELEYEKIRYFPCTDLHTIDHLWVQYSRGCFGLSVQKQIYLEIGGVLNGKYDEKVWEKFGDTIGWRIKESWIPYSKVTFETFAPRGNLLLRLFGLFFGSVGSWGSRDLFSSLVFRLVECNL